MWPAVCWRSFLRSAHVLDTHSSAHIAIDTDADTDTEADRYVCGYIEHVTLCGEGLAITDSAVQDLWICDPAHDVSTLLRFDFAAAPRNSQTYPGTQDPWALVSGLWALDYPPTLHIHDLQFSFFSRYFFRGFNDRRKAAGGPGPGLCSHFAH